MKMNVMNGTGSFYTLFIISKQERLKEEIVHQVKMEKTKLMDRPSFIYYRLLMGLQILFEGAKCLFKFRLSKEEKLLCKLKSAQKPVFTFFDDLWLEAV